ncbi:MAG: hypothetical protein LBR53_01845 [Deltaproteobacteria bacterium]|nr:hypothetical protein [Deltaproteobacteria bacterium]
MSRRPLKILRRRRKDSIFKISGSVLNRSARVKRRSATLWMRRRVTESFFRLKCS